MQDDDGAWAHVGQDVLQAFLGADPGVEVAAEDVPKHDLVVLLQEAGLTGPQVAVGRAEQAVADEGLGLLDVAEVEGRVGGPTVEVVVGVVAGQVAGFQDPGVDVGVLLDVVAHAEEGGPGLVGGQLAKHPGCHLGDGTVVEGEVHDRFLGGVAPLEAGEKRLDQAGCADEVHLSRYWPSRDRSGGIPYLCPVAAVA